MSERRHRFRRPPQHMGTPLTLTWAETAAELRVTESWLRDHIRDLPDFPRPDPLLDVFATEAVEGWVRRRFGLVAEARMEDAEAILLSRVEQGRGQRQSKVPRRPPAQV